MTRQFCRQSLGSLRRSSRGGKMVIENQGISVRMVNAGEKLRSEGGGGWLVATSHPPEISLLIRKSTGVLGGDARIRDTRIAVWMLVRAKQLGMTDEEIRSRYHPPLGTADIEAAWQYYDANKCEIDRAIAENEAD